MTSVVAATAASINFTGIVFDGTGNICDTFGGGRYAVYLIKNREIYTPHTYSIPL